MIFHKPHYRWDWGTSKPVLTGFRMRDSRRGVVFNNPGYYFEPVRKLRDGGSLLDHIMKRGYVWT